MIIITVSIITPNTLQDAAAFIYTNVMFVSNQKLRWTSSSIKILPV